LGDFGPDHVAQDSAAALVEAFAGDAEGADSLEQGCDVSNGRGRHGDHGERLVHGCQGAILDLGRKDVPREVGQVLSAGAQGLEGLVVPAIEPDGVAVSG
jgi:hypothetical protein